MQVKFTTVARNELKRILDVYIEFADIMSAEKFGALIDRQIGILSKHPYIGHPEPLLADYQYDFRSKSINENYSIIYVILDNTWWIYDFWDRRHNPKRLKARIK